MMPADAVTTALPSENALVGYPPSLLPKNGIKQLSQSSGQQGFHASVVPRPTTPSTMEELHLAIESLNSSTTRLSKRTEAIIAQISQAQLLEGTQDAIVAQKTAHENQLHGKQTVELQHVRFAVSEVATLIYD
jgi:hypothetical protein